MPSLFLDTNFLLDSTGVLRPGHDQARKLVGLIRTGFIRAGISPHSLIDYFYITRSESAAARREILSLFIDFFDIVPLNKSVSTHALMSHEEDYEDAVIGACAEEYRADFIITRDLTAFKSCAVPPLNATEYLKSVTS